MPQDLAAGNTTKLVALAQQLHVSATAAAAAAYAVVAREVDEHLPFVKKHWAEALGKAEALYKKHVAEAAWVSRA
jgi:hypothetical protein